MINHDEGFQSMVIPEFPDYAVTNDGRAFNINTGREMVLSPTMQGELTVGMMKDGKQYRRSVKVLVAQAFVDGYSEEFNTPIQLNGDKWNLNAENIEWRPRWFAWKYSRQFDERLGWFYNGPILDITNNIKYPTIFEAAISNGSLCDDIYKSIMEEIHVWPTGEKYTYV